MLHLERSCGLWKHRCLVLIVFDLPEHLIMHCAHAQQREIFLKTNFSTSVLLTNFLKIGCFTVDMYFIVVDGNGRVFCLDFGDAFVC